MGNCNPIQAVASPKAIATCLSFSGARRKSRLKPGEGETSSWSDRPSCPPPMRALGRHRSRARTTCAGLAGHPLGDLRARTACRPRLWCRLSGGGGSQQMSRARRGGRERKVCRRRTRLGGSALLALLGGALAVSAEAMLARVSLWCGDRWEAQGWRQWTATGMEEGTAVDY